MTEKLYGSNLILSDVKIAGQALINNFMWDSGKVIAKRRAEYTVTDADWRYIRFMCKYLNMVYRNTINAPRELELEPKGPDLHAEDKKDSAFDRAERDQIEFTQIEGGK